MKLVKFLIDVKSHHEQRTKISKLLKKKKKKKSKKGDKAKIINISSSTKKCKHLPRNLIYNIDFITY